jgi:hypothetical protein
MRSRMGESSGEGIVIVGVTMWVLLWLLSRRRRWSRVHAASPEERIGLGDAVYGLASRPLEFDADAAHDLAAADVATTAELRRAEPITQHALTTRRMAAL